MTTALTILLALVNLVSRVASLKCFECKKRLRLRVVRRNGETSIECSCCWKHATEGKA